ncbi:MAG: PAS domain S-box protein [Deltaproteobacteria bacterium]|nr:PAS domain S-box protein [Deltaproteobacteria bacterium]
MVALLTISIILQFLAAVIALRLIRQTGVWPAWVLIACSVSLMAVRRSLVLSSVLYDGVTTPVMWTGEIVGLFITVLMISGLSSIRPMFRAMQRSERELTAERNFVTTVLDTSAALVVVLDRESRIVRFNGAAERVTGYKAADVYGKYLWDHLLIDSEVERVRRGVAKLFSGRTQGVAANHWRTKSGELRLIEWTNTVLRGEDERIEYIIGTGIDVTERQQARQALTASEDRYRTLMESASDAIVVADAESGTILDINRKAERLLGKSATDLVGRNQTVLHAEPDRERYRYLFKAISRGEITQDVDSTIQRSDGSVVSVAISAGVSVLDGRKVVLGIFHDMTERQRIENELRESERRFRHMSYHDELTGLRNRSFFDKEMAIIDRDMETIKPVSVIAIDVDGLKTVNDSYGHRSGDEVLVSTAKILTSAFSGSDIVSRVGGDEFAVILPGVDWLTAVEKGEEIKRAVAEYNRGRPNLTISLSLGVASSFPDRRESIYEIFQRADDKMYSYKLTQATSTKSRLVDILMSALAERDRNTSSHIERLVVMCSMMAERMNLDDQKKRNLILLARMHDLGKVGVPDEILFKPGKLTSEELPKMREHVIIGYNIALRSKELRHIADLVLHHHEFWNGEGYPKALAGESIPQECRILAVVDAYDAMTSDRPYHRAVGKDEAFTELRLKSGTQFDPAMVDIFVALMQSVPMLPYHQPPTSAKVLDLHKPDKRVTRPAKIV